MMKTILQYGVIAAIFAGFYFFSGSDEPSYVEDDIDLNAVLDVTVDTLHSYQEQLDQQDGFDSATTLEGEAAQQQADMAFIGFADELAVAYNAAQPALYDSAIGVSPQQDASLFAYDDVNGNQEFDESESALFKIEIDGENARIIASSRSGAVNDHHFSGSGLLAGYLIGSLLSRQRAAGVNTKNLASKQKVSSQAAARARAGSGSHSSGK